MILVLDDIRSVFNVGSIFRTAEAAGIKKIFLCGITPTPINRLGQARKDLAKVSLGAEKIINWEYCSSAARLISKLKSEKYYLIALEQNKKSEPLFKIKPKRIKKETALVVGNEVKGIRQSILEKSDLIAEIPMLGQKESLNVAVALGIAVYHLKFVVKIR